MLDQIVPYSFGFGQSEQGAYVGVRGPKEMLDIAAQLEGAFRVPAGEGEDESVVVPGSRLNVMALESIATPTRVTDGYRYWRSEVMKSPVEWRQRVVDALVDPPLKRLPLDHQLDFLARLYCGDQRSWLNASEQGTGKTMTGWLALQLWGAQRALIVCPKSLVREWEREWRETWQNGGLIGCVPLDSGSGHARADLLLDLRNYSKQLNAQPMAIIVNYEMVDRLMSHLQIYAPDVLICDESWRIKNPSARCTKAVLTLADEAQRVLLLTGTPIGNHVGDLWSQLRALGRDVMPENYYRFLFRYAEMRPMQLGPRTVQKPVAIADAPGLMKRLEPVWYRATKAACLDLPPKIMRRVSLSMPASTRSLLRDVKERGEVALGHEMSLATEAVVALRQHEIAGGHRPTYNEDTGRFDLVPLTCPKIKWIEELCRDVLVGNPTARCIIWATYTHELERITEVVNRQLQRLPGKDAAVLIYGGTPSETLERCKASFKSRAEDGVQVLVCQLRKMAFGHNLQEADFHVYFSNNWSYVVRSQSEDRSHRSGRVGAVSYVDLVLEGSIDEEVLAALDRKSDFAIRLAPNTAAERNLATVRSRG